ncbi:hypothetical protein D7V93_26875 [Corallococcus llansteffanensis]|uniref:Uncharacterized protein n=1 Tax=Corallococcus llansteffanensis TaxID=2316731 RepID=A0A3A8PIC5_9BACT|nr:hypothetical protein D7V93_26875 [Corallococcus llansteffanensis]
MGGVRTLWFWRPGMSGAVTVSHQVRGAVLFDPALSYVAFLERDAQDVAFVRVARTETCTDAACPLATPLQVQGGKPVLSSGGKTLLLSDGPRGWLIDVPSSAVTDLGLLRGPPFISPKGTRYGVHTPDDSVQLFDTATRTPLWEHVWKDDVWHPGWWSIGALMLDEVNVLVNTEGQWGPVAPPLYHITYVCDAQGCRSTPAVNETCSRSRLEKLPALACYHDPCATRGCAQGFSRHVDSTGAYIPGTIGDIVLGPTFSDDQGTVMGRVIKEYRPGSPPTLVLEMTEGAQKLSLAQTSHNPFGPLLFVPNPKRLLFRQMKTLSDGATQSRIVTWDGGHSVVEVGELAPNDQPAGASIVRDNPPTLYMDVSPTPDDAGAPRSIIRVPL